MLVRVVEVLEDNFSYLIVDEGTKTAAALDPVEPEKVVYTLVAIASDVLYCKVQQAQATIVILSYL